MTTIELRPAPRSWTRLTLLLAARATVNPRLAVDLLRAMWAFRRRSWWKLPPFLPLPDREYLQWRMYTAYGHDEAVPPVRDVIGFARWRRETMGL
jgi:type II secretory pathway predicted ATPase ExeA